MKAAFRIVFLAALAAAQGSMPDALRRGIVEQNVNRNTDAAVHIYESAIQQHDADREATASIMFRLAECYRSEGKDAQATSLYARLVREYPEQSELVEQARQHLTDTPSEKAAQAYRNLLRREIDFATERGKLMTSMASAKSTIESETARLGAELSVIELQCEAAAFDAGFLRRMPVDAGGPEAVAARSRYRSLVEQAEQRKLRAAELSVQQNPSKPRMEGLAANLALEGQKIHMQRVLIALDAGILLDTAPACGGPTDPAASGTPFGRLP